MFVFLTLKSCLCFLNSYFKKPTEKFRELEIPQESVSLLSNIAYVAQKSGNETTDGMSLKQSILLGDMEEKDNGSNTEKLLLDLRRRGLITINPIQGDFEIIFKPDLLSRVKKIKEWISRFEMEIN